MTQPTTATPVGDLAAGILPPTHPLLLLPIRVETALDGTTLLIRVYPDEVHIDRRPTTAGGQPTARPRLLPTRFVATGWRDGARVFAVAGLPVAEDALRVALDLDSDTPAAGMDWLQDFSTAAQAGMAMRVTVDPPRLDRLLVFGVRDDLDAAATQAAFADVLSGRDDVRFVTSGEATNQLAPSGSGPAAAGTGPSATGTTTGPPATGAGTTSGTAPAATTAASRLTVALGLPAGTLDSLDGAAGDDDPIAAAMHAALWPGTLGYYLAHRLGGPNGTGLAPAELERGRRAFVDHVRAEGPLPTLRIGDQPYGFLPTSTLDFWVAGGEPLGAGAVDVLRKARSVWLAAAASLPTAAGGPADLLEVLRNSPTIRGIDARTLMGPLYAANLLRYIGMPEWAAWMAQRDQLGTAELRAIGLGWTPPAARSVFAPGAYSLRESFVAETSPAFLTMLAALDPTAPPVIGTARPFVPMASVLDQIARYAVERAYADASGQEAPEGELLGFGLAGQVPLAFTPSATSPAVTEQKAALTVLGSQPVEVLNRHLTGTLDLAAHRIDAWITAVATGRLNAVRSTTATGLRVGAFGWVEGLVPRAHGPSSEGWIAAPSTAHATTAAVLRNGFRARRLAGETPGTLAVDLSSRRVRHALRVLDEVRAGRTLSAVLAEQLERGMHDAGLDPLIERIRAFAPQSGGGGTDGLSVAQQWTDHRDLVGFDFGSSRTAMAAALDEVVESLDAVADLTLAEGVHQVVTGNPVRAGALFDALGRGEQPPPEITVTTTPRRSVHHTIRLMVAVPDDAVRVPGDWPAATGSVRAAAEPRADAWAGLFLGPAAAATFTVSWTDGSVSSGTLADLDLAPLDVVALVARPADLDDWLIRAVASSAPTGSTGSVTARPDAILELAGSLRRVLSVAQAATPADIDPNALAVDEAAPDPAAAARAAAAAQALDQAIAAAVAADAAASGAAAGAAAGVPAGPGASAGATGTELPDALVALARFGVSQALPAPGESVDAMHERAGRAIGAARRRATAAAAAADPAAMLAALFDEPFPTFGPIATTAIPQRDAPTAAAAIGWIDLVGRVHTGAGALSDVLLYDEALGRPPSFALIQQPHDPSEPTLLDNSAALPDPRHLTLLRLPLGATLPAQAAAILVDGWVEPVPNSQETAGLAFHLERPATQPPQACLIAVPPDPTAQWTTATLEAVLLETLDAARMRSVPAEALLGAAQFLPALQFANNTAGETVSASFIGLAVE